MKKKLLATLLAASMVATCLVGCGNDSGNTTGGDAGSTAGDTGSTAGDTGSTAGDTGSADNGGTEADAPVEYGEGNITIWVPEATVDFTKEQADAFIASNPDMSGYTVTVEPVGEGDAAGNMITDVEGGADIYAFAQDQITRLVSAGALCPITGANADFVSTQNDAGAASAAVVGGTTFAYPMTSDNGYFLYYDSSVVTDPTSLEQIVADCEAAGKNFYMEINSGWYQPAFFFATGCTLTYDTDDAGNFTACNIDYVSDAGLVALKEIIELASSSSFQNGSSVDNGTNIGAIVDGTWDSDSAKAAFGDNYACAKLPSFTGSDGNTYQLSGFGGFKLLGIKPQEDAGKLAVCHALAQYLTSTDVQIARYQAVGFGPSNLTAQQDSAVQADEALSALAAQLAYTIPQGNYPGDYWTLATALGDDIITGTLSASTSDDDLKAALQSFQDTCISYAQ
ncbi:MAG: extracellular solute-binding protein [Lachnospiraceae bacterium]|nr:extracellular solute-binding protein [Lachnospiraceae bacterium]